VKDQILRFKNTVDHWDVGTWKVGEVRRDRPRRVTKLLVADFEVLGLASLISNFRLVLNVLCFLLGNSPASRFYMPTFRNTLFHLHRRVCMKTILQAYPSTKLEQSVPKRWRLKFRGRGITQKKAYNRVSIIISRSLDLRVNFDALFSLLLSVQSNTNGTLKRPRQFSYSKHHSLCS